MLTDSDREILKPVLGSRYSAEVLKILHDKEKTKGNGKPYGNGAITAVFNGKRKNVDIEIAIWELFNRIVLQRKRIAKMRKTASDK